MRTFFLVSAVMFMVTPVNGEQMTITATGEDDVYVVSGSDFGSAPEVIIHDDFDQGKPGEPLTGWDLDSSHGLVPIYSSDSSITGENSGKARFTEGSYNSSAEFKDLGALRTAYFSYYVKIDRLSGDKSRNVKLARLTPGYKGNYLEPKTGVTLFDNQGNGISYLFLATGDEALTKWFGNFSDASWHRIEHYVKLSSPSGTPSGETSVFVDGVLKQHEIDVITDYNGESFEWLTMPYYVAHSPGGDYNIYYDNVFLSDNRARVEVCKKPKISECNTPVIPKVLGWQNEQISVDLSQFFHLSNIYLYIYKSDGSLLNKEGIKFCVKCPNSPAWLER